MKELLEQKGFTYKGFCKVCDGQAELYVKGNIECKIHVKQMRFLLQIGSVKIKGKSSDLEYTLNKYAA